LQQSLLRLVRLALQADGAAMIGPKTEALGDPLPWPAKKLLEALAQGHSKSRRRLLRHVVNGALVVWVNQDREWTAHQLEMVDEFAREMEPHFTREGMLNAIVERSDAAIFVKDAQGRYLLANPATADMIGVAQKDLIGRSDEELFPPEVAQVLRENDRRVLQEGLTLKAEETVPMGEKEATFLSIKFPLESGREEAAVCGIATDVTDRIEMAHSLARTRERLDLALEGVGLGLWMCDFPINQLEWSDRCKKHFGLPADAEVDIDLFFQLLHPDDREPTQHAFEKAIAEGTLYDVVYRAQGQDGVDRHIRAIGRCSYDKDGTPYRIDGLTIDVSETIEQDRALRMSENRYRSLIAATAAITWVAGPNGELLEPQTQWEQYTGQSWAEHSGNGWREMLHPDDRLPLERAFREAAEAQKTYLGAGRLWHAESGEYRHFEVNGVPVVEDGEIQEWIGIVVDVHDRLASERRAMESSLRFQAALNQSVGFIAVLSPQGRVLEINQTPLEMAGLRREDVLGKLFWETPWWKGRPEAQQRLQDDFRLALEYEPIRSESFYYLQDGTERVADRCLTASKGLDGEVAFVLAEGMDITDRVRAESGIRLLAEGGKALSGTLVEEEMLEGLFSVLLHYLCDFCIWDRALEDKSMERTWRLLQSKDKGLAELLDRKPSLDSGHLTMQVFKSGQGLLGASLDEAWLVEKGLTPKYARKILAQGVHSIISLPVMGRGRILGVLTVGMIAPSAHQYDQTDYQFMDELAFRLGIGLENARLYSEVSSSEQRFRTLSSELAEARDEALRADRMKSQFLANMSHEIRTPLAGIQGMLDLLTQTELTTEQQEFVDTVKDCSQSLLTVLDDVLDLARIDAGKLVIQNRPFQLTSQFRGTLSLFELQAQKRRLDLRVNISDDLPNYLLADPDRFRQLLVNLVSNAMKFTHEGYIEIRMFAKNDWVRVEVEDSGVGIEADKLENLWNAFEQVDSSSSRRYEGAGLGLSIVRRLVTLMKGRLGVDSEPQKGSTFWFELPLVEAQPESLDPSSDEELDHPGEGRILVAEDNPINRRVLVGQLTRLGYQVLEARNGKEVLDLLENESVDLIFMDCQMPEIDGYTASKELRARGLGLPILALTAHAMSGERVRCLQAGMDDHITKPLSLNTLISTVRRWLPKGQGGRQDRS
jgi:two-component system, sensor histidine kinase